MFIFIFIDNFTISKEKEKKGKNGMRQRRDVESQLNLFHSIQYHIRSTTKPENIVIMILSNEIRFYLSLFPSNISMNYNERRLYS